MKFLGHLLLIACLLGTGTQLLRTAEAVAQNKPTATQNTTRAAVTRFFNLLKAQEYAQLHDLLPSELRQQITAEQLTQSLNRLSGFLQLERMEIGRVQEKGDFAVVDTIIYGNVKKPLKLGEVEISAGRVATQQYLVKEAGQWKVATADNRTRNLLLKRNPAFAQQFQLTQPQFSFKQGKQWTELKKPART